MPRLLTATGKAKSPNPNGGPRSGYEVIDRRGFVRTVGSMATSPQNDAGVADLREYWEEFDVLKRYWVAASNDTVRTLEKMTPARREAYLRGRAGLVRKRAGDAGGIVDGEAWHCPRDYDRDRDREAFLEKALKLGMLSLGTRTYKLRLRGPSPHQGGDKAGNTSTTVYIVTRAAGEIRMTREALLLCIEQNYI